MLLLATATTLPAKSRTGDKTVPAPRVTEALQKKAFKLDVLRAMPSGGKSIPLTHDYSLAVKSDSVFSDLPYFGRAYSLPYGGGEGLRFEAPLTGYKQQAGRKGKTSVSFNAKTEEDTYVFNIEFFPDGRAHIRVNPNNRQGIGFSGALAE